MYADICMCSESRNSTNQTMGTADYPAFISNVGPKLIQKMDTQIIYIHNFEKTDYHYFFSVACYNYIVPVLILCYAFRRTSWQYSEVAP